jgi:hypothetical protein
MGSADLLWCLSKSMKALCCEYPFQVVENTQLRDLRVSVVWVVYVKV